MLRCFTVLAAIVVVVLAATGVGGAVDVSAALSADLSAVAQSAKAEAQSAKAEARSAKVEAQSAKAEAQSAKVDRLQLRVLSSRPELVSGGDALVGVELPAGISPSEVKLTVNGTDATRRLKADAAGRSLTGLVTSLTLGSNTLTASAPKKSSVKLTLVNHPITGPLFSGTQEQPFVCITDKFKLQGGGTLGPPLDANCSIATRID